MIQENFQKKLEVGKAMEQAIAHRLTLRGFYVSLVGDDHRHDLQLITPTGMVHRLEVKADERGADTGNLCIEYAQGRTPVPSGIRTTMATIVAHVMGDEACLYLAQPMRTWLEPRLAANAIRNHTLGDNNNRCVLVKPVSFRRCRPWFHGPMSLEDIPTSDLWSR